MIGMSFALRGGERRACVKWRVKWWLERAREVEAWRIRGKSPVGANTRKACLLDGMFKRGGGKCRSSGEVLPFGANAQGAFGGDMV